MKHHLIINVYLTVASVAGSQVWTQDLDPGLCCQSLNPARPLTSDLLAEQRSDTITHINMCCEHNPHRF